MSGAKIAEQRIADISAFRKVRSAVEKAMSWEYPSLVIGPPGNGKTTALQHLCEEYKGYYIEVTERSKSPGGILREMINVIYDGTRSRTVREDEENLVEYLKFRNENRLLQGGPRIHIGVDEQQTLLPQALREVLRYCARAGVHLTLSGNAERLTKSTPRDIAALEQIRDRIGHRVHIGRPDPSDCQSIAIDFNAEGADTYAAPTTVVRPVYVPW